MVAILSPRRGRGFTCMMLGIFFWLAWPSLALGQENRARDEWRGPPWVGVDSRPMLGVYLNERDADADGVLVTGFSTDNSPAKEAGVEIGDRIVSIAGHRLSDGPGSPARRLREVMRTAKDGEELELEVLRDGESLTFAVTPQRPESLLPSVYGLVPDSAALDSITARVRDLTEAYREKMEEWRESLQESRQDAPDVSQWRVDWRGDPLYLALRTDRYGLDLVELNPDLGAYFGTAEGVLVADAPDDSPLGLRPGDVVVSVEGRTVDDVAELQRILHSYEDHEEINFRIWRNGAETALQGTIAER